VTQFDFSNLTQPLTADDPCGPDLDFAGDEGYLNFLANAEGLLPSTFFVDGQPFDRSPIDIDHHVDAIEKLSARTRDLRLVALLARFLLLKDDLAGFGKALEAIAALLETQWEAVHPRAEDGAFALRAAIIGTLDVPTVVFPLQFIPLCENRRLGPVSYRTHMYAAGDALPRDGESVPAQATLQQVLRDEQAAVLKRRDDFRAVSDALKRVHAAWLTHSDFMSAPRLDQVTAIVDKILAFIASALPSAIASGPSAEMPVVARAFEDRSDQGLTSADDVRASLRAVAAYFNRSEPSSPVLPLVLQAEQLMGKSLVEVLQILLPNHLSEAAYQIGGQQYFALPVGRLSGLLEASASAVSADAPEGELPGPRTGEGEGPADLAADGSDGLASEPTAFGAAPALPTGPKPMPAITDRRQAMAVLEQISVFLRAAEPSSPIPWLIERARTLADRDFLGILRALLPPGAMSESEPRNDNN
jgi:type VI secretion system protein ImpA